MDRLKSLEVFRSVAELGSFTKAAKVHQLVAGFTLAQSGCGEVMWRERAGAVRVVKRSIVMLFLSMVYQDRR
jgi:hypothetical protein